MAIKVPAVCQSAPPLQSLQQLQLQLLLPVSQSVEWQPCSAVLSGCQAGWQAGRRGPTFLPGRKRRAPFLPLTLPALSAWGSAAAARALATVFSSTAASAGAEVLAAGARAAFPSLRGGTATLGSCAAWRPLGGVGSLEGWV